MKKRLGAKFSSKTNVTAVARAPTPPKERPAEAEAPEPPAAGLQIRTDVARDSWSEQTWNSYRVVLPDAPAPAAAEEAAADDAKSEYTYTYDEIPAEQLAADQQIDEFADQIGDLSGSAEPVEPSPSGGAALGVAKTPQRTPGAALDTPYRAPNTCSSTVGAPSYTPGAKTALAMALADEDQRPPAVGASTAESLGGAAAMASAAAAAGEDEGEEEAEYYSDEDETVEVVSHRPSAIKERMAALENSSSSEKQPSPGGQGFPEPPQGRPSAATGSSVRVEAARPDEGATLVKPNSFQAFGQQVTDAFGAMLCVQQRKPGGATRKGCGF